MCNVTRHGAKRSRQRVGIPKKAVDRNAEQALTRGIGHSEARGRLRHYIEMLYARYDGNGNNIRIYNGFVYVFHDTILITVLNLPAEYRRSAEQQKNRT